MELTAYQKTALAQIKARGYIALPADTGKRSPKRSRKHIVFEKKTLLPLTYFLTERSAIGAAFRANLEEYERGNAVRYGAEYTAHARRLGVKC